MKLQIISAALLLSLSQLSFAAAQPKPSSCPSVSAIQAVGITYLEKDDGLWYAGVQSNNYATNEKWTFAIGAINATNEDEARSKAVNSLASLTLQEGPIATSGTLNWVCLYNTKSSYTAGAVTPAMDSLRSLRTHI